MLNTGNWFKTFTFQPFGFSDVRPYREEGKKYSFKSPQGVKINMTWSFPGSQGSSFKSKGQGRGHTRTLLLREILKKLKYSIITFVVETETWAQDGEGLVH